ncbi:hypothetical protein V1524DRAFT_24176 [Lipomyces starkeyi]
MFTTHIVRCFIFSAGLILAFEAFRQKSNVESYIVRGISLCMFILDYYDAPAMSDR